MEKKKCEFDEGNTTSDTHIANCCSLGIVEERHQVISRVRHKSTKNSSHIATGKTNTKLQICAALVFWSRDGMFVYLFNNILKSRKLHHCICNKPNATVIIFKSNLFHLFVLRQTNNTCTCIYTHTQARTHTSLKIRKI